MEKEKLFNIVEKARLGDEEAFDLLCREKVRDILYICIHLMGNAQDGEDAAQEVMLHMQNHIHELKEAKAFQVWLYRITNGICSNLRRKRKRKVIPIEEKELEIMEDRNEFLPYDFFEDNSKKEMVLEIVHKLPYKCKICILMFYYEDMSYQQIGEILHISKTDVSNNLVKAKKIIKKRIEKQIGSKDFYSRSVAASSVPVLSRILKDEVHVLLSEKAIGNVLSVRAGKAGLSGMEKAAQHSSGTAGQGAGIGGKVLLGTAIITGTAVIGWSMYKNHQPEQAHNPPPAAEEESIFPQDQETSSAAEEVYEIEILEDMVGDEDADVLRSYVASGGQDKDTITDFLKKLGLANGQSVYRREEGIEDTLYEREEQQKRLMVITRYIEREDSMSLKYKFTHIDEAIPTYVEISICYDEW